MTTATATRSPAEPSTPLSVRLRQVPKWIWLVAIVVVWRVIWEATNGNHTLYLPGRNSTSLHQDISQWKSDLIASRDHNVAMQTVGWFSDRFESVGTQLQYLISTPEFPRPVPQIGWVGVVAIAGSIGLAIAGWRIAILVVASFVSFGLLGYWEDSMDTLIVTFFAVAISIVIGLPLGIWMARSKTMWNIMTPLLDLAQTMPSFNYLIPVYLFFGLGLPCAVVVTVLYATPPMIRISAHGIRSVSGTAIEATDSLGQTSWQRLRKVQLPMAKGTIIVALNQTIMASLSMVIIAGFVNGPGLGNPILEALAALQVGKSFVAGLCIVIMAIMLDRTTTAASTYKERLVRSGANPRHRQFMLIGAGVVTLFCIWLSRYRTNYALFPETSIGQNIADKVQSWSDWFTDTFGTATEKFSTFITEKFLNNLQDLLALSPWFVTAGALMLIALVLAGVRGLGVTALCLFGIWFTDLWYDAMVTLAMVLVGTALTMVIALVLGVAMARNRRLDIGVRPILDAAQVMPPFVYLIPALALFGPSRFTAIAAAVIYAVPVAAKLVADGIVSVSPTTVEAAESAGTTSWQMIRKVQLPMAKASLILAANQGLLYVLSMVVIGGLVGGGALGYDSVLGFSQSDSFGKGLAAALAIVLLGIMLDRVFRWTAERSTSPSKWKEDLERTVPTSAAPAAV